MHRNWRTSSRVVDNVVCSIFFTYGRLLLDWRVTWRKKQIWRVALCSADGDRALRFDQRRMVLMETTLLRSARRLPPVRHRGAPPRATTARPVRFGRARLTAVARRTTTRTTTRGRTTVAMRRARTRVLHLRRRLPRACPRRCCRLRARWGRCAHPRCRAQAQWKPTAQRKAERRRRSRVGTAVRERGKEDHVGSAKRGSAGRA